MARTYYGSAVIPLCFQPRFILEGVLELTDLSENARFGSALAPVPDLNGDSFNDLVVGSPLEDEHRGAIYMYNSQRNRILRKYKQVGMGDLTFWEHLFRSIVCQSVTVKYRYVRRSLYISLSLS